MSLQRSELYTLIEVMKPILNGAKVLYVNELAPRQFIFEVKKHSHLHRFLLSLQEPFLRIHMYQGKKDGHISPFFKILHALTIGNIEMLNTDRIVKITFTNQTALVAELFPKRPNLYLIDSHGAILQSLNPSEKTHYEIPPKAKKEEESLQKDPDVTSANIEARYNQREAEAAFHKEKHLVQQHVQQQLKKARNALEKAEKALNMCLSGEMLQHEGQLLQANLYKMKKGLREVTVEDWEAEGSSTTLTLDPRLSPQEEIAKRFKESKKRKAGLPHAKQRLEEATKACKGYEEELRKLSLVESLEALQPFIPSRPSAKAKPDKALPYYIFTSKSGLEIWVGKNAASNEKLTFSCAKGSDWWLHVSDYPGSHVVIRVAKNQEPDAETLQEAAQLALKYSKAKDQGEAEICVTQRKYVSKMGRGARGQVQLSKHKKIIVRKKDISPQRHRDTEDST